MAKDYDTLLNAFAKVVKKEPDVGLFILGKGLLEINCQKLVNDLGIAENVHFAGFDKNPFKYLSACDVYVLSSSHEGMPGVLVQAMACGAACVSTDCPTGPNELINHGQNGFLVPVGNVEELSSKLIEILSNSELKQTFKDKAPEAVKRFQESAAVASYFSF